MLAADAAARSLAVRAVAAAGIAGFGCMAAELTAVRLLAPHFGDSAYVWTNVIGVILAALAGGATLGGRWAGRDDVRGCAALAFLAAGVWIAGSPFLAGPLGSWLLPAELPLDAAMLSLVRGSFVATAVLFAAPMVLLGAISPLLVTALTRAGVAVGRAVGRISAAGTLGSLLGTFLATHWLVPQFGCRVALALAGTLLIVAGLLLGQGRRRAAAGVMLALAAGTTFLHTGPLRPPTGTTNLLAEVESRCQFLQVLQESEPGSPVRTRLAINEGLDSFHSLAIAGSVFTDGAYYDWQALAPLLAGDGKRPPGLRALSIGDAAGTLRRIYAAVHPGATVDAVDIDGATMRLGDEYFPGPKATGQRFVVDGRVCLEHSREAWHVIHVDAYAHQVYVPAHLASREFFEAAKAHLLPGGVIACNVGALDPDDPVLRAIGTTLAAVFGNALSFQIPNSRNSLLVARRDAAPSPASLAAFAFGAEKLNEADLAHWHHLVESASAPSAWVDVGSGGIVLTDDRPVLDRLLNESYVAHDDPGSVLVCSGPMALAGAEIEAYGRRQVDDWPATLHAVQQSQQPSAFLREVAGDARWAQRQLHSAIAEYEDGQRLATDETRKQALAAKLQAARDAVAPIDLAAATATRNRWLQLLVSGVAVAIYWLLLRRS